MLKSELFILDLLKVVIEQDYDLYREKADILDNILTIKIIIL